MDRIKIKPVGLIGRLADLCMIPVMYVVSGTFKEKPQRTHKWNNRRMTNEEIAVLDHSKMVHCLGVKENTRPHGGVWFHLPIFGGWRDYVVLSPPKGITWHVGWLLEDKEVTAGISRIKINGPVRMLVGSGDVLFFGLDPHGRQVQPVKDGEGRIGEGGPYSQIPLF